MDTIIGVGFSIPSEEEGDYFRFDSKKSLSDADIVVFSPNMENTTYSAGYPHNKHEGKTLYDYDSSFRIKEHFRHWENELLNSLKAGKNIFIILSRKMDFFIYTGQKEISGTGKNQKVTEIVEPFDNYRFLPTKKVKIHHSEGSKIHPVSGFIKDLYECIKAWAKHEVHIEVSEEVKKTLFATKNNDKTLGMYLKIEKGHLIFIPAINIPDAFYDENEDVWRPKAIIWGKTFKNNLVEINRALKSETEKTPKPLWVNDREYFLKDSLDTIKLIEKYENEIAALHFTIAKLQEVLSEKDTLKNLLYETGKPLELSVIKSLNILGYSAENYNDGHLELDQIIISPEGERYIGECEGKDSKDIDINKFRQLQDSLNEDFEREEVSEKAFGILFGNPQRLVNPLERTLDFTEKCKRAADREKIALIKTTDLFEVVRYILESGNEKFKIDCRMAIKTQLGKIVVFPTVPSGVKINAISKTLKSSRSKTKKT